MDAFVVENHGSIYFFRRNKTMPTSGMFMDHCWFVAQNDGKMKDVEVEASKHIHEQYMGVSYDQRDSSTSVCTAKSKKNIAKNKGAR